MYFFLYVCFLWNNICVSSNLMGMTFRKNLPSQIYIQIPHIPDRNPSKQILGLICHIYLFFLFLDSERYNHSTVDLCM